MRAFGLYGALLGRGTPESPTSPCAPFGGAYPYNDRRRPRHDPRWDWEAQGGITATRGLGLPPLSRDSQVRRQYS